MIGANATSVKERLLRVAHATLQAMNEIELGQLRSDLFEAAMKKVTASPEHPDGNRTQFGKLLGYKDGGFVRQMIAGSKPVTEKTIRKVESLQGMSGWFTRHPALTAAGAPTPSGVHSKHELLNGDALNKHHSLGMFDGSSAEPSSNIRENDTLPGPTIQGQVPVISWDQARTWDTLMHSFSKDDAERWLPCPAPHSASTFCIENNTEAMDDGTATGYREGEILFVDPEVPAAADKDAIVILPNGKMLFRRLKEDGEGPYLLALNGRRIDRWEEGMIVRGVVIFSGVFR